jgi:hypothetical protein
MSETVKNCYGFLKADRGVNLLLLQSIIDAIATVDDVRVRSRIFHLLDQRLHSYLRVRNPQNGWVLRL